MGNIKACLSVCANGDFHSSCCSILVGYLLGLLFDPEDGGSTVLRNIGKLSPQYMSPHLTRQINTYLRHFFVGWEFSNFFIHIKKGSDWGVWDHWRCVTDPQIYYLLLCLNTGLALITVYCNRWFQVHYHSANTILKFTLTLIMWTPIQTVECWQR